MELAGIFLASPLRDAMNISRSVVDYLLKIPILQEWNEARCILERTAALRPRDWRLPLVACDAVGGRPEQAIPACAALACTQISIILVDDMLDEDPRGYYRLTGAGQAANLAAGFLSAGAQAILCSQAGPTTQLKVLHVLNQMIVALAFGQYLDVQNSRDEKTYWRVVKTKSAPFFGAAIRLGALFGGASESAARALGKLGRVYGEMIQIHDDLHDTMVTPAGPDWTQRRSPLPILFAQLVDHPDQARFVDLYRNIQDERALQEAQEILIRCGAVSYCVDQLLHRYEQACGILNEISLVRRHRIAALLDEVIAPVQNLLQALTP